MFIIIVHYIKSTGVQEIQEPLHALLYIEHFVFLKCAVALTGLKRTEDLKCCNLNLYSQRGKKKCSHQTMWKPVFPGGTWDFK